MRKLTITNQPDKDENIAFHFHVNTFEEHTHDFFEIMLITEGTATHIMNGVTTQVKPNEAFLIKPTDTHSLSPTSPSNSRHLNISISAPQFNLFCNTIDISFFSQLNENNLPLSIKLSQHDCNKIINFAFKYQSIGASQSTKKKGILNCMTLTLLQEFYLSFTSNIEKTPTWLKSFIANLSTIKYLEMKPNEVFQKIPYSYSNFEKLFKKHMGVSFVSYFNSHKIEYAKSLLTTTDFSVITIANKICMHSLGHFYNVFKEKTGVTPTQYRKQHKVTPY